MGMFIRIEVHEDRLAGKAEACAQVCPVNIFAVEAGRLKVLEAEEDECTLCELCLQRTPEGAISIQKLY